MGYNSYDSRSFLEIGMYLTLHLAIKYMQPFVNHEVECMQMCACVSVCVCVYTHSKYRTMTGVTILLYIPQELLTST